MQWYYAIDGQRHGPISEQEFAQLVADGTVSDETLVWHQGLEAWAPWSTLSASHPLPAVGDGAGVPSIPVAAPTDEDATDSGVPTTWTITDFSDRLRSNGFNTSVEGCMGRAWANYKSVFGLAVGITLVGYLIVFAAGLVPILGIFSSILVTPQITGGVTAFFLRRSRGDEAGFDSLFDGFTKRFGRFALVGLLQAVVTLLVLGAMIVPMLAMGLSAEALEAGQAPDIPPAAAVGFMAVLFVVMLVLMFFGLRFLLVHVIIMDTDHGVIDAFRLSWRITGTKFWTMVGLCLLMVVLAIVGTLALLIGLIFTLPLIVAMVAQIYQDACDSVTA
ncbi:GYF domain-containing protein [Synoicihabitans lomoniglobus]|nr:GYF domain-containing protein [Opitutaceae bacterium LMO-M01]